jgi:hypothetical protein
MICVSLAFLVGYALTVTGVLVCVNARGAGILAAGGMTLLVCAAVALVLVDR